MNIIERMINDLTGIEEKKTSEEKETQSTKLKQALVEQRVDQICYVEVEEIPLQIIQDFDRMDDGDPMVPPRFACEHCGGEMESYIWVDNVMLFLMT